MGLFEHGMSLMHTNGVEKTSQIRILGWNQEAPREGETPDILEIHKNCRRCCRI